MSDTLDLDALELAALAAGPVPWDPDEVVPFACMKEFHKVCTPEVASELIRRLRAAEADLAVTERLYEERQRLLDAIPACEAHGACVPHAIEWVGRMKVAEAELAALREQEPVAWLHTMHMEFDQTTTRLSQWSSDPFGIRGADYSEEYTVTSEPLCVKPKTAEVPAIASS